MDYSQDWDIEVYRCHSCGRYVHKFEKCDGWLLCPYCGEEFMEIPEEEEDGE